MTVACVNQILSRITEEHLHTDSDSVTLPTASSRDTLKRPHTTLSITSLVVSFSAAHLSLEDLIFKFIFYIYFFLYLLFRPLDNMTHVFYYGLHPVSWFILFANVAIAIVEWHFIISRFIKLSRPQENENLGKQCIA